MADGKMLGDLLHVFRVKEGVVAGFVWRLGRGERRGRHRNRMNQVARWQVSSFCRLRSYLAEGNGLARKKAYLFFFSPVPPSFGDKGKNKSRNRE